MAKRGVKQEVQPKVEEVAVEVIDEVIDTATDTPVVEEVKEVKEVKPVNQKVFVKMTLDNDIWVNGKKQQFKQGLVYEIDEYLQKQLTGLYTKA